MASVSALAWMLVGMLLRPDSLAAKRPPLFSVRQDGFRNETDDEAVVFESGIPTVWKMRSRCIPGIMKQRRIAEIL